MALNIMIVDDSETVRSVLAKALRLSGVEVNELHQASNGREALDLMAANWIDLIFCDINMPVMGGVEMIEAMQTDEAINNVPVVIVSTEGSKTRMEQLKSKGVVAYIRKPFTPETIRSTVESVIGGTSDA
jgi:two-component system chemotaxis response regulator CheY